MASTDVSTHSRLKAAGRGYMLGRWLMVGFNTQPPEGGWLKAAGERAEEQGVSTHSRLKAAGPAIQKH